jgi:hypothetical protein
MSIITLDNIRSPYKFEFPLGVSLPLRPFHEVLLVLQNISTIAFRDVSTLVPLTALVEEHIGKIRQPWMQFDDGARTKVTKESAFTLAFCIDALDYFYENMVAADATSDTVFSREIAASIEKHPRYSQEWMSLVALSGMKKFHLSFWKGAINVFVRDSRTRVDFDADRYKIIVKIFG